MLPAKTFPFSSFPKPLGVATGNKNRKKIGAQPTGMIRLTRLNNSPLVVNSDLIKFVEQSPDTLVTLITGEKIVVQERATEVLDRVIEFRRAVLQGLSLTWDPATAHIAISKSSDPSEPKR